MEQLGLGALHSPIDSRTFAHPTMGIPSIVIAGQKYNPEDHEHQHNVGICTAISLVQNAEKVFGKKYSPDFQYLLQKKFIDGNWDEGSAIFSALKVGKNFGFLPIEEFTYVTEEDRKLPYPQYITKLQAIPQTEITRLLTLCKDKVTAYAQVDISSREMIAKAIYDSEAGILCRYEVGNEWWTV